MTSRSVLACSMLSAAALEFCITAITVSVRGFANEVDVHNTLYCRGLKHFLALVY